MTKQPYSSADKRDVSLGRLIALTTLRRYNVIELILEKYLKKPIKIHSPSVHNILCISLCQILYLDTPPYAVVNIAIELTKKQNKGRFLKNLVNAILRKISLEKELLIKEYSDPILILPKWIKKRWLLRYGEVLLKQICSVQIIEPPLDLTVKKNPIEWAKKLTANVTKSGSVRLQNFSYIPSIEGYDTGDWWVQDAAATIPIKILGNIKNKNIIDICAAPGGKTAGLINNGAIVTALDINKDRIKILTENLKRLKLTAKIVCDDGLVFKPKTLVDIILLDPPCTSTGVMRRHPDILHRVNTKNLEYCTNIQKNLLESSIKMIKNKGIVVYCTCSLEPEEGEEQIDKFILKNKNVRRMKINPIYLDGFKKALTSEGDVRILPNMLENGGNDGFFISMLEKINT